MQVASTAELRQALRTATPGETIDLAPGEYQEPFFIDNAVTLRGLDRKTVLWRRSGPVIYVRTPNVTLDKLLIERTVSQGPLVVHEAGNAPTGRESKPLDALINLGALLPGSTVTLPLELETAARAEVAVSGLYGAQVSPSTLEAAGRHIVWLTLDGNSVVRGEVLLGEIAIREGNATRYIWLSGSVIEAAPDRLIDRPYCLAYKKNRLYPSQRGLMLDSTLLAAIEHIGIPEGRYAFIQRDPTGVLFLYMPSDSPAPLLLNNKAIARWNRVLLHEKDTIKIGDVTLSVVPAETIPIRIEPTALIMPDFADQFPGSSALTLFNDGRTGWKGRVIPSVAWLNVAPEGDFRVPASRSNSWAVQLNSEALALSNGLYEIFGGLLVVGTNHIFGVDVRVNVCRPDVALQVEPLDIGAVEWGQPFRRTLEMTIGNLGRGVWTGSVRSAVSWLNVITPMPITCNPWAETTIQIEAAPDWDSLPIGTHDLSGALIVESPDGEIPVAARLEAAPPQPHLVALTPLAIFDQVERNAPLPDITIQVRNDGAAAWNGTIRALNGWVRLNPGEIAAENIIAPGATADISVHLLDVPAELALGTPVLIDEIRFESDGAAVSTDSTVVVGVQLTVVELPPFLVANEVNFAPFVKGDNPPEGLLRIHNNGPARWRGTVIANTPWLTVPDSAFTCEPGTSIELYITLNSTALDNLQSGLTHLKDALSITGGREPLSAAVHIDMRELISELYLETPTLNFGRIDSLAVEVPTQTVRLVNAGPAATTAKVELCVPWLSVQGTARSFDIEVPGMSIIEFNVRFNDVERILPPGVMAEDRALVINGREKQMTIRALLVVSEALPLLTLSPKKLTLTGDTPQTFTVCNSGKRPWAVQIKPVSWLTAVPAEFTLDPGQERPIEISRKADSAPPDGLIEPRAVVIVAPGREFEVEVNIDGKIAG